ncbi:hypothetical protein Mgra_00007420 [Meloidogyne graminicola]|uniref:Uncharacterized protein n=1 Tax=Meloidogyne graminicola TaxID=189291 RepID=A0A8S9ZIX1_9BILA|nr:hypothetical protein Mgra_00007420 [Meloidogyne graminicola]
MEENNEIKTTSTSALNTPIENGTSFIEPSSSLISKPSSSNNINHLHSNNNNIRKVFYLLFWLFSVSGDDSSDEDPAEYLRDLRQRVQFKGSSQRLLNDSDNLYKSIKNRRTTISSPLANSSSTSDVGPYSKYLEKRRKSGDSTIQDRAERTFIRSRRSLSPDRQQIEGIEDASTSRYLLHTPKFPRIDFDDFYTEDLQLTDRKPAWHQLEESVKSSYNKPRATAERHRQLNEYQDTQLNHLEFNRARRRHQSVDLPFTELTHLDSESFLPRAPSWMANDAIAPRGMPKLINSAGSGPYCAPHLNRTQGIERPELSRFSKYADDVTARLLKTSILPEHMKTITSKEFRSAPFPSVGSASEQFASEDEMLLSIPRTYYSRPNRDDKDYFDFDLQHSVDMYRRPEGKYLPTPPQHWETKLLNEYKAKGEAPLSGYMFTKGPSDYRAAGTSYLSAALRFWEHRFAQLGVAVRESNPVTFESLERNRPRPSRFTTYSDPNFEDYEDPKADDT